MKKVIFCKKLGIFILSVLVFIVGIYYTGRNNLFIFSKDAEIKDVKDDNVKSIIEVGMDHGRIMLKQDGTLWAWGSNRYGGYWSNGKFIDKYGALGIGSSVGSDVPIKIGLKNVTTILSGYSYTLALKEDGTVWTWGENENGQLGDGTNNDSDKPVKVVGLKNVTSICSSANDSICALKKDGTVWAWGYNKEGELGIGTNININKPVKIEGLENIVTINCGEALKKDGTVWYWGNSNNNKPAKVEGVEDVIAMAWPAVLKKDGTVWDLPNGYVKPIGKPTKIEGFEDSISIIESGNGIVTLKKDGTVWASQVGQNLETDDMSDLISNKPVNINGLKGIVKTLSLSHKKQLALKKNGTVCMWNNKKFNVEKPVEINGLTNITSIIGISDKIIAIENSGKTWEINDSGECKAWKWYYN